MLCVDCGTETEHTIGGSCPACFTERTPLLSGPDVLEVELCAHCDARHIGAHWVDPQEGMPLEWIREDAVRGAVGVHTEVSDPYLQFAETPQDSRNYRYEVILEGRVDNVEVDARMEMLVRQKRAVCDRCSRMYGNYYASIIQLRATERDVTEKELAWAHKTIGAELDRMRASGNRFAFLNKSGPQHGGWDYYLGDIEAGRQVSRMLKQRLGASVQETAKLVGRREGDDVHRVTFLVRIRLFAIGDYAITPRGRLLQVQNVQHGKVIATDLATHSRTRVPEQGLKRLGGPEVVEEAVVVSHGGSEIQLLDPSSYRAIDIPMPEGYEPGEMANVIRHDERLFLAPQTKKV